MADLGFQVDLLVFDAAPQSFDEHVVAPSALAVHRQQDAAVEHASVNSVAVNWLLWSVLTISCVSYFAKASSSASTAWQLSRVIATR